MSPHREPRDLDPASGYVEARPGEIRSTNAVDAGSGAATAGAAPRAAARAEGAGITGGLILLLVIGFALVVLVAQNTDEVRFEFLGWDAEVPLVVLLLAVAFATLLLDQIVGWIWRRRRRRVRELTRR